MHTTKNTFSRWAIMFGVLPGILMFVILNLGPSLATSILSFTDITGLPNMPWRFIGLQNYKEFFLLQNYRDTFDSLKRTIIFSSSVTFFQNAVALFVAIILNSKFIRGRNFYRAVIFFPVILGSMVTALIWKLMLNPMDGPVANIFSLVGASSNFFSDRSVSFSLVIFCQCWMNMGYSLVIFLSGLQGIPTELYEAGTIDGTSSAQAFRYITIPMIWSTITINVLLALIGSLSTFQIILFTTGGNFDTDTLAMRIYNVAFGMGGSNVSGAGGALRQGYASAQSMVLFVIVLLVTLAAQTVMNRKEKNI